MPASDYKLTSLEDIPKKRDILRNGFKSGKLRSLEYRKYQILQLIYMIKENSERFDQALIDDTGRPVNETRLIEVNASITECLESYHGVDKWAKPEKPAFNPQWFAMKPTIHKEPKGTVLIIVPFNYPVWLSVPPIAGAIAAGNTVLLKPSESTPSTSALLEELLARYVDSDLVQVVNGAIPETTKLLELQWDHILYTGSGRVARIVSAAAAKHLTPVTLELGGKSPVFIDADSIDLPTSARRLFWGKVANAGQTCVAPDYVLCPRSFQGQLIEELKKVSEQFFPDAEGGVGAGGGVAGEGAGKMTRVTTEAGWRRLKGMLDATKGDIVIGGETDEARRWIAPTVVKDVKEGDSLLSDEIFGPILPIVPVDSLEEALAYVNARDHPLAIYVFSTDEKFKTKVRTNTQSGGFAVNETIFLPGVSGLPFGGVGPSGSGYHTGKFTFDIFTHLRASIDNPSWVDKLIGFRFPPYTKAKLGKVKGMQRGLPKKPLGPPGSAAAKGRGWGLKWLVLAIAIAVAGGYKKLRA